MKTIALIGAGQLGRRHLQALSRLAFDASIDVVDPVPASLDAARTQFEAMPGADRIRVRYLDSVAALPAAIDVAIIATNADVRAAVVRALLEQAQVGALVLEKVLFQDPAHYEAIGELMAARGTQAWVNHPRRLFPLYAALREELAGARQVSYTVQGGGWGLACNGLHFIDHLAYLTGADALTLDAGALNPAPLASKRAGFVEISGALRGQLGPHPFSLFCHEEASPVTLTICSDKVNLVIDESGGQLRVARQSGQWQWETLSTKIVHFQSELSDLVVNDIVRTGSCGLPTYAEAARLHLPFIACVAAHLTTTGQQHGALCPIT